MKYILTVILVACTFGIQSFAQSDRVPVTIILNDGKTIQAYHFGQLECSSQQYFKKNILIKGRYEGVVTELNDYREIQKLQLLDFKKDPVKTGGNEQGTIVVSKKDGATFTMEDATISLTCYGVKEMYNQLEVQMQNPINNKLFEKPIDTKDIQYIVF